MKILIITPDVTSKNILQSYTGNTAYNLVQYCINNNLNFDTDFTIMRAIKQKIEDYSALIDSLNVYQYDSIIVTGLCTLDKFLPKEFSTYIRSKMNSNALLCQLSDYPTNSPNADITFSTKAPNGILKSCFIGWGANPDYYKSEQDDSDTINILLDHTHYVEGEYDNTEYILSELRNIPNVNVKRIGNKGEILGINDPIERFDRSGLNNEVYKNLLAKTDIFIPTHKESVGLSVLEAAMSGCLIAAQEGFIYDELLNTVKHIKYAPNEFDINEVIAAIDCVDSRRIALDNTWGNVFNRMVNEIMFRKMSLSDVREKKGGIGLPYVVYTENLDSEDLLVYFGNYNGHIRGVSTVEALNCNALFVRSDEATWYLQEFAYGNTPEAVAKSFDNFINSKPHIKRVVFAGFSMGAFAALLYGTFSNRVNKIVATSPQTKVPTFPLQGKVPVVNSSFVDYASIRKLWDVHGAPDVEVILQACKYPKHGEEYRDYDECVDIMLHDNVKIKVFDCEGHNGIASHLLSDLDYYNNIFLYTGNLDL